MPSPLELYRCLRGPKLFRKNKTENRQAQVYTPNMVETTGNKFISVLRFCFSFSYWTSPVMLSLMYRRGYFCVDGLISLGKVGFSISVIYLLAWLLRGIGRSYNQDYITFIQVLAMASSIQNQADRHKKLSEFDFEFWAWPTDFSFTNDGRPRRQNNPNPGLAATSIADYPMAALSYTCAHTFGRRMMYPGSTALINTLLESMLIQERGRLVDDYRGRRCKVQTEDNNEIDTMFIDRRGTLGEKGRTLVITCEGNSGFYEIGCTKTPLDAGYSVLGWNHPGFAGSSGSPTPEQDQNAMDAVMQYAIQKLNFTPDNIWLFAWSIGGYPASWAAKNYPDIKYVTLDATFDHVEPLAVARMPQFAKGLVSRTIKTYLNLNNMEQICQYPGPVLFIRRTQDEMITTRPLNIGETPMMSLPSNRGNDLLVGFLKYRYPNIVDDTTIPILTRWLAEKTERQYMLCVEHGMDENECSRELQGSNNTFPSNIGAGFSEDMKKKMTLYLASKHLKNFDTTHCTPLPADRFEEPWRVRSHSM